MNSDQRESSNRDWTRRRQRNKSPEFSSSKNHKKSNSRISKNEKDSTSSVSKNIESLHSFRLAELDNLILKHTKPALRLEQKINSNQDLMYSENVQIKQTENKNIELPVTLKVNDQISTKVNKIVKEVKFEEESEIMNEAKSNKEINDAFLIKKTYNFENEYKKYHSSIIGKSESKDFKKYKFKNDVLNTRDKIIESAKNMLKPYYQSEKITKQKYKDIMREVVKLGIYMNKKNSPVDMKNLDQLISHYVKPDVELFKMI